MSEDPVISMQEVCFAYGRQQVLKNITLDVKAGEVVGLLGPNGAGKTTTVRVLNGLLPPEVGSVRVLGLNPVEDGSRVRQHSGTLTETSALYERLSAQQNLEFFGRMSGMHGTALQQRIGELLTVLGLEERAKRKVGTYSKGMKQRLSIARAMLSEPMLLYLDEPASGLDPEAAGQVHQTILDLSGRTGNTVVLCTHNLYEAEALCGRLFIMNKGRILGCGTMEDLRRQFAPDRYLELTFLEALSSEQVGFLSGLPEVLSLKPISEKKVSLRILALDAVPSILRQAVEAGLMLCEAVQHQADLHEIYMKLQKEGDALS